MTIISFGSFYFGIDEYQANYFSLNHGALTMHHSYYRLELGWPLAKRNRGPT
jgi:hypothetical protein